FQRNSRGGIGQQRFRQLTSKEVSNKSMRKMRKWLILLFLCPCAMRGQTQPATEALDKLANDVWSWRGKNAPSTADDVNRLERRGGVRDWSAAAIDRRTRDLKE